MFEDGEIYIYLKLPQKVWLRILPGNF